MVNGKVPQINLTILVLSKDRQASADHIRSGQLLVIWRVEIGLETADLFTKQGLLESSGSIELNMLHQMLVL